MDKKSIIGLVLICLVFLVFGWLNRPTEEQRAQMQKYNDSIAKVQNSKERNQTKSISDNTTTEEDFKDLMAKAQDNDSLKAEVKKQVDDKYAMFSNSVLQEDKHLIIENEVFSVDLSNKGGIVNQVELKKYTDYNKKKIKFFTDNGNTYGLNLSVGQVVISTSDLYFVPFVNGKLYNDNQRIKVSKKDSVIVGMRLYPNKPDSVNITNDFYYQNSAKYIEYRYVLRGDDYRLGYSIVLNNMQDIITDESQLEMFWQTALKLKEKDVKIERQNSSLYYKLDEDVEHLKQQGRDDEKTETGVPISWISFKQQFFSNVLICRSKSSYFESARLKTITEKLSDTSYMRTMLSGMALNYDGSKNYTQYDMDFFYGPNRYNTIKKYDIDLEKTIPLGWGFFLLQWINRFVIIPVFDLLMRFDLNFGIIILILTFLVKLVLFPLNYKSFSSTAKMNVLKPEIDKLNEKYPKQDQAMQKQQAVMQLYKRAGVNPAAGCLPMLLQMPILIAMFRFFPSSIELRQQSFLWADDLSTYDSFITLPQGFPLIHHISLFCLIMTAVQLLYTKMTMNQQSQSNAMPGMKLMMYGMPLFMFFMLNNFSAALNYYYLLSLLISVVQMFIIRKTINEQKILQRLKENSKKPMKKTKWQQRMEALEKKNRQLMQQRNQQRR